MGAALKGHDGHLHERHDVEEVAGIGKRHGRVARLNLGSIMVIFMI